MSAMSDVASRSVRIRLDLAYDGTDFHGWALQPGLRTVQGEVEAALALMTRQPLSLTVAGRTDAGVHARHQVAHVDVSEDVWRSLAPHAADPRDDSAIGKALTRRLNSILANARSRWAAEHHVTEAHGVADVVIRAVNFVDRSFDARFSALGRRYCYRLSDAAADPLRRRDVLNVGTPLDLDAMNEASAALLGEHDFLSYCRPRVGATTIRTLKRLEFQRVGGIIECHVEADAFCHSMVRSLVGAALRVGQGREDPQWMKALLDAKSRTQAAPIAPPHGLSLEGVDYPQAHLWAQRAEATRVRRDACGCAQD